jgi:Ca2+-transporting ATPase
MQQPPRPKNKPLLDRGLLLRAYGFLGIIEGLLAMVAFFIIWWSNGYGLAELQSVTPSILTHTADERVMNIYTQALTMTLGAIVACQIGNLFACRSEHSSALRLNWFSNPLIWYGIAAELGLMLLLIYVPPLAIIFSTAPLAGWQIALLFLCPPLLLGTEEIRKRVVGNRRKIS